MAEKKKNKGDTKREKEAREKRRIKHSEDSGFKGYKHQKAALDGEIQKPSPETSSVTDELRLQACSEFCSISETTGILVKHEDESAFESEDSQSSESQFESVIRDLIVNWVPPPIQTKYHDVGDQRWLFESVLAGRRDWAESETISGDVSQRNIGLRGSARFLARDSTCALPFVPLAF